MLLLPLQCQSIVYLPASPQVVPFPSYFSWCPPGDFLAQLLPGLLITDMVKFAVKVVGKVGLLVPYYQQ